MTDSVRALAANPPPPARDRLIDGWRGVAVLCVIYGHAVVHRFGDFFARHDLPGHLLVRLSTPVATAGVQLFFVISGYIITSLLLREEERRGQISLSAFYARRAFRILPPFLGYLLALTAAASLGWIMLKPADLGAAGLFLCNTGLHECGWFTAHSWSLAVEEQFYLVWPLAFLLAGQGWRTRFVIGVLGLLLLLYVALPWHWHSNAISFACIAVGALCALVPGFKARLQDGVRPWAWLCILAVWMLTGGLFGRPMAEPLVPLFAAATIFGSTRIALVRVFLESASVQWLGGISYSLYLWQQLFLASDRDLPLWPGLVLLLPVAAYLSKRLIEEPFVRIGHKVSGWLTARKSVVKGKADRLGALGIEGNN